jgi:hypothetical protein
VRAFFRGYMMYGSRCMKNRFERLLTAFEAL